MAIILSTLSSDVIYTLYDKTPSGITVAAKSVKIAGGTGVIDKRLVTPEGVTTSITDAELEVLEQNPVFKKHVENGFIKVTKSSKTNTKDMEKKDKSAQLTPDDFEKKGLAVPVTNAPKDDE